VQVDLVREHGGIGELQPIARSEDPIRQTAERIPSDSLVLPRAQNEADRRSLAREGILFPKTIQVGIHLPCVRRDESPQFQVDRDQATKTAVIEEEIEVVRVRADLESLLPRDERESVSKFQHEVGQVFDQVRFEALLGLQGVAAQEIEDVRVLDGVFRRESPARSLL
jgi:hypothetical protein